MFRSATARAVRLAAYAFALSTPAIACAGPIDTDGPDFVESSEVVPPGRYQYELDAVRTLPGTRAQAGATFGTPLLVKYGAAHALELRLQWEGWQSRPEGHGSGDLTLGAKWHSHDADPDRGRPAVSWILDGRLSTQQRPEAASGPSADRYRIAPGLRSVITWQLDPAWALGVMPGVVYDVTSEGRRSFAGILGVVLNRRLSERHRVFGELSVPRFGGSGPETNTGSLDLGTAWLLTPDTQLGARAGVGLNERSPRRYLLLELAQRF